MDFSTTVHSCSDIWQGISFQYAIPGNYHPLNSSKLFKLWKFNHETLLGNIIGNHLNGHRTNTCLRRNCRCWTTEGRQKCSAGEFLQNFWLPEQTLVLFVITSTHQLPKLQSLDFYQLEQPTQYHGNVIMVTNIPIDYQSQFLHPCLAKFPNTIMGIPTAQK